MPNSHFKVHCSNVPQVCFTSNCAPPLIHGCVITLSVPGYEGDWKIANLIEPSEEDPEYVSELEVTQN